MQPIHAYEHARDRALFLVRLCEGLTNHRSRGIRSDWKAAFCDLMHWPKSSAIQRIDGKDAIVILRDGCSLAKKDFDAEMLQELLRSALVLTVSALDRYMHERIVKKIVGALKKGNLCKEQSDFTIPAALAIQVAHKVVSARRKNMAVRPANEIRIAIQEILHKQTFQSWREIEEGFKLIGISGVGGKLQAAYGNGNMRPVYAQLNKVAQAPMLKLLAKSSSPAVSRSVRCSMLRNRARNSVPKATVASVGRTPVTAATFPLPRSATRMATPGCSRRSQRASRTRAQQSGRLHADRAFA